MLGQKKGFQPIKYPLLNKEIRSRIVGGINGLQLHILEAGYELPNKQLILLLHGFPELAYSWRKVILPLSQLGYHVVAPDLRGYGKTTGWNSQYQERPWQFRLLNYVSDICELVDKLGYKKVHSVVGHDFGSPIAGWCATQKPNIFRSLVLMSAPFAGFNHQHHNSDKIHQDLLNLAVPRKHYQWYYTTREANADIMECNQGLAKFFRAYYHMKSGDWKTNQPHELTDWVAEELAKLPEYYVMKATKNMAETVAEEMPNSVQIANCKWLTETELQVYAKEYSRTGFQGGLNCYWNLTDPRFNADLEPSSYNNIEVPTIFISGDKDWGMFQAPGAIKKMEKTIDRNFLGSYLVEGAGHWVQQESPGKVFAILKNFLKEIRK